MESIPDNNVNNDMKNLEKIENSIINNEEENEINNNNNEILEMNNEDEGKEEELEGQIIFRRIFGKKLAMISIINNNFSSMTECVTHDSKIIKELIIGDIVRIKGKISYHKSKRKIDIEEIHFIKKGTLIKDINKKRKEYIKNINNFNPEKSLCLYIKRGLECPNKEKCNFRHEYKDKEEEDFIKKNMERKENMYNSVHIGDIYEKDLKNNKNKRNSEFADFIVEKFNIEDLKKGFILDIAGGKGITSFYLTLKYKLKCIIIDPRGCELPKKYIKELEKENLKIEEKKIFFNCNNAINFVQNSSLIIGMHPDEATNDIVDTALKYHINFAVVPCCVFHSKFPERKLQNGNSVVEYNDLIQFLLEKDPSIQIGFLNIHGRNKVLYKKFN